MPPSLIGWIVPLKEVKDVYRIKYLLVLPTIGFELSKRARVSSLPLTLPEHNPRRRLIDIACASWHLHDPIYMSQQYMSTRLLSACVDNMDVWTA